MAKPTYLARENLAARLASDVLERIAREEIAAGERLPTEAEIAAQYGVSRTVVREAISRLRAEGIVTARPGAGTFVTRTGWNRPFRIDAQATNSPFALTHVLELRMAFEVEAARLAAERRSKKDIAELQRCLDGMATAVGGEESGVESDVRFHRTVALAAHNPLFNDFFEFIDPHIRRGIRLSRQNTARLSQRVAIGLWLRVQEEHRPCSAPSCRETPLARPLRPARISAIRPSGSSARRKSPRLARRASPYSSAS